MGGTEPASTLFAASAAAEMPTPISRKNLLPPLAESKPSDRPAGSPPSEHGQTVAIGHISDAETACSISKESLKHFRNAGHAVVLGLKVANGFSTLRDRGGVIVQSGDLRTVRKLGEGAFAVVEEAMYAPSSTPPGSAHKRPAVAPTSPAPSATARRVAVKRLKPEVMDHEGDLESFMTEVALLRKLANKRIVEFIGVGSTDTSSEEARRKTMFLVQEFMDGGTLKKVLSRQMIDMSHQLYTYMDAFRWALQIAEGLEYLHSARPMVIHRDLKLENILLKGTIPNTADVKIADFGLVALVRPRDRTLEDQLRASRSKLPTGGRTTFARMMSIEKKAQSVQEVWNQTFQLAVTASKWRLAPSPPQQLSGRTGSYMYMAPEMYRLEVYNEKVDVFSYGVIVFEILSRYQMVCAVSIAGTEEEIENYAAKVSGGYRPPLPPNWPPSVRELISMCCAQDPAVRPAMSWVRERLVQLQTEGVAEEMQRTIRAPPVCGCAIM